MFSLIITIISIALVAALAVASVYYGGSAFSQGTAKASASTLVAQAQQIAAANTLRANDNAGVFATTVGQLKTEGYLSSVPAVKSDLLPSGGASWTIVEGNVVTIDLNDTANEVAAKVNESIGSNATPAAHADADKFVDVAAQYGVVDHETTNLTFFYKG